LLPTIRLTYELDPLTCPKCKGQVRILAFIEDREIIAKILKHLGLWDLMVKTPPKVKVPFNNLIDDSDSQVQFFPSLPYPDPHDPMDYDRVSRLR
jgi:hypothetical protein